MPASLGSRLTLRAAYVAVYFIRGVRVVLENHPYNETELKLAEEAQIEGLDVPDGCHPVLWAAAKDLLIVFWFLPCFCFCLAVSCVATSVNNDRGDKETARPAVAAKQAAPEGCFEQESTQPLHRLAAAGPTAWVDGGTGPSREAAVPSGTRILGVLSSPRVEASVDLLLEAGTIA